MKYLALLRGINVGGNNKVEMKKLKELFENLGYANVSTYINSGNILFDTDEKDSKKLTTQIEPMLENEFGFKIPVLVRSHENILAVVKAIPQDWQNDLTQKTDVLFLWDDFDNKKSLELLSTKPEIETTKYVPGAIIWNLDRAHYNQSGMYKFIGTELYKNMTARNVNTVRKLASLATK